jgi:hypothetical protein
MAMTTCRECGHQISTTAKTCPSCGAERAAKAPIKTGLAVFTALGFGLVALIVARVVASMNGYDSTAIPSALAFLVGAAAGWYRVMR